MKLLLVFVIVLIFTTANLYAQNPDCKNFRTGKFEMTFQGKKTTIIRKGNKQLQYYDGAKTPTEYTVKWVDGCTFTLTPQKAFVQKLKGVPPTAVLTEKIIKTSKHSYTQFTSANFTKRTITTEIKKIDN